MPNEGFSQCRTRASLPNEVNFCTCRAAREDQGVSRPHAEGPEPGDGGPDDGLAAELGEGIKDKKLPFNPFPLCLVADLGAGGQDSG
jgi:hypothetical protein